MSHGQSIIAICPTCNNEWIYKGTAQKPRVTCNECHTRFYIKMTIDQPDHNHDHNKPPLINDSFIDDPDELLYSVAIRELNKPQPDPRWATILINCKKENIKSKDEVIDKLQSLPTRNITEILKKQHIKSWQSES